MKAILFYEAASASKDDPSYFQNKATKFYAGNNAGSGTALISLDAPLPIVASAALPTMPDPIMQKINEGIACVLKELNPMFLLEPGETIEKDFFSYLHTAFQSFPADTVVLNRKTSVCNFYIVFPGIMTEFIKDEDSGITLVQFNNDGVPAYPIPPMKPIPLPEQRAEAGSAYAITSLKVNSSTQIQFGWSVPDDPSKNNEWWAVYQGVMPEWAYLGKYNNWAYIAPKNSGNGQTGTQTVTVDKMASGAIYTFALFSWKWNLVDYQQFTAP